MSDQDQEEETEFIEDVGDEETNEQACKGVATYRDYLGIWLSYQ